MIRWLEREARHPVRQMTPTSLLAHARLNALISSSTVRARNALYRSGRLIVIQASPLSTLYVTSVKSSMASMLSFPRGLVNHYKGRTEEGR